MCKSLVVRVHVHIVIKPKAKYNFVWLLQTYCCITLQKLRKIADRTKRQDPAFRDDNIAAGSHGLHTDWR